LIDHKCHAAFLAPGAGGASDVETSPGRHKTQGLAIGARNSEAEQWAIEAVLKQHRQRLQQQRDQSMPTSPEQQQQQSPEQQHRKQQQLSATRYEATRYVYQNHHKAQQQQRGHGADVVEPKLDSGNQHQQWQQHAQSQTTSSVAMPLGLYSVDKAAADASLQTHTAGRSGSCHAQQAETSPLHKSVRACLWPAANSIPAAFSNDGHAPTAAFHGDMAADSSAQLPSKPLSCLSAAQVMSAAEASAGCATITVPSSQQEQQQQLQLLALQDVQGLQRRLAYVEQLLHDKQ
jgi:hypothetical protein